MNLKFTRSACIFEVISGNSSILTIPNVLINQLMITASLHVNATDRVVSSKKELRNSGAVENVSTYLAQYKNRLIV